MNCKEFKDYYPQCNVQPLSQEVGSSGERLEFYDHLNSCEECNDWWIVQQVTKRGFDVSQYPCIHIAYQATQFSDCGIHTDEYDCPDSIIMKTKEGYGIPIHDGGDSCIEIQYCPWCGVKV